jgi:hypothetical protein
LIGIAIAARTDVAGLAFSLLIETLVVAGSLNMLPKPPDRGAAA